jgi:polar amino acid transport system permease protein
MFLQDALDFLPILLKGAVVTVQVTAGSFLLSSVIGLMFALMMVSKIRAIALFAIGVVNVIRGLPIIVQLFYIYFVLPDFGIQLSAMQAGVIGLGIAYSAYQAENFRAGIQAIDHGQIEAAESIGMRGLMIMRRMVLPQAFRIALPPYGNTLVMMLKDSSLVSTITVAEMTRQGQLIASSTFENMTVYTLVALLYLSMSLPLSYRFASSGSTLRDAENLMIELKGVYKHFGSVPVLEGVDLQVGQGEVVCLTGPSGSGKSTLLRCINGLESYSRGEILVSGQRVDRNDKSIHQLRTRVAMVFQRFNLFPHRTALENVMEGPIYVLKQHPQAARTQATALLEKVGLAHRMDAYPDALSGGQQQRVAIAPRWPGHFVR